MTTPSVQLWSIRHAIDEDMERALARLVDLGFRHVEPYAFHTRVPALRLAFDQTGLTAPSGHASVIDSETPEQVFDAAAELGIYTVIDPSIKVERWETIDGISLIAERANELSALAAQRGLEFGYHNHAWELETVIDGRHALEHFVDRLDPAVVLEVDAGWSTIGGADTPALLRQWGDRVRLLHVKDGTRDGDIAKQLPAGSGELEVAAALAAAPQAVRVVEFDDYAGDVFEGLAASLAWLAENDTSEDDAS